MLRSFQKSGSNTNTTIPTTASNKTSSSTKYVTVRTDDRYVQVLTSNDGGRISKVASLRVVVILEDLGISSSNKSSSISTLETISNVAVTASARLSSSNATRQHPNARMENANAFGYATTNTSNRNLTQNTTNNNIQGTLNNMIFSSWRISIHCVHCISCNYHYNYFLFVHSSFNVFSVKKIPFKRIQTMIY